VNAYLASHELIILENMTRVSRREGWGGKTGTAIMPAFKQAMKAMMKSSDGG
jgi:hypothetical protein